MVTTKWKRAGLKRHLPFCCTGHIRYILYPSCISPRENSTFAEWRQINMESHEARMCSGNRFKAQRRQGLCDSEDASLRIIEDFGKALDGHPSYTLWCRRICWVKVIRVHSFNYHNVDRQSSKALCCNDFHLVIDILTGAFCVLKVTWQLENLDLNWYIKIKLGWNVICNISTNSNGFSLLQNPYSLTTMGILDFVFHTGKVPKCRSIIPYFENFIISWCFCIINVHLRISYPCYTNAYKISQVFLLFSWIKISNCSFSTLSECLGVS